METESSEPQGSTADPLEVARVSAYYDQTWLDYRILWLNPDNNAIHFGYWDDNTRSHTEALSNMNRALAERVNVQPGERILDAGCGVGGEALWLAANRGAHVVGITLVASQVDRASRTARERGLDNLVEFRQEDFTHTSFPDASFDIVWAEESVCHTGDKPGFIAESFRVLKPGGRLVLLDYFRVRRPLAPADEHLLHSWLSGWVIPDIATTDEFVTWANRVGFEEVNMEDIESHVRPSHERLYKLTMPLYPFGALFHFLGLRSDVQHGNVRGARDQWRALQRGLWFQGIFTARKPD